MSFSFGKEKLAECLLGQIHEWDSGFHSLLADCYADPCMHKLMDKSETEVMIPEV